MSGTTGGPVLEAAGVGVRFGGSARSTGPA